MGVFFLSHLFFLGLHLYKLFVEPLLFLFAFFLELLFVLIKSRLFFDECSNRDDLMLLDSARLNFFFEGRSIIVDNIDLFLVLLFFILDLSKLLSYGFYFGMECCLLVGLLLDSHSKFFNFQVVSFLLLLVEKRWIIHNLLFLHSLKSINRLGDDVNIFGENIINVVSFNISGLSRELLDTNIKLIVGI